MHAIMPQDMEIAFVAPVQSHAAVAFERVADTANLTIAVGDSFYWSHGVAEKIIDPAADTCLMLRMRGFFSTKILHPVCSVIVMEKGPRHGRIERLSDGTYKYVPKPGFIGMDWMQFLVNAEGRKVRVKWPFSISAAEENGEASLWNGMPGKSTVTLRYRLPTPVAPLSIGNQTSVTSDQASDMYRTWNPHFRIMPVTALGTGIKRNGNNGTMCFEVIGPERRYDASSAESPNVLSPQHYAIDLILKPVLDPSGDWPTDRYMAERTRLLSNVRMKVVEPPRHGKLLPVENGSGGAYFYLADQGYFGMDRITFSITFHAGPTVLLDAAISVTDSPSDEKHTEPCLIKPAEYRQMRRDHKAIEERWKARQRADDA